MIFISRRNSVLLSLVDTETHYRFTMPTTKEKEYITPELNKTIYNLTGVKLYGYKDWLFGINTSYVELKTQIKLSDYYKNMYLDSYIDATLDNKCLFILDDNINIVYIKGFMTSRKYFDISSMSDTKADIFYSLVSEYAIRHSICFNFFIDNPERVKHKIEEYKSQGKIAIFD